jgi:hypothetical protein
MWGLGSRILAIFRKFRRSAMLSRAAKLSRAVVNCGIPLGGGDGSGDRFLDKKN